MNLSFEELNIMKKYLTVLSYLGIIQKDGEQLLIKIKKNIKERINNKMDRMRGDRKPHKIRYKIR